jgi:hypothetical protein
VNDTNIAALGSRESEIGGSPITPGSTSIYNCIRADIAWLIVGGGPGACVTQQSQTCNIILGSGIRKRIDSL